MFTPQETKDGSFTFFSSQFGEAFHSVYGAKQEAEYKFVIPTEIRKLAQTKSKVRLLDICYGLGYNSAAAIEAIWQTNPQCKIELMALEMDAEVPQSAIAHSLLTSWQEPIPQLLANLANHQQVANNLFNAQLLLGDARNTIQQLIAQSWQADAIFLDPFSPPKCPQLWTVEFVSAVSRALAPTGKLATYSCAAAVRTALSEAGLRYGSTTSVGRKAPGTIAGWQGDFPPLSQQEREHLQTLAAIPYRDPQGNLSSEEIKLIREQEQQSSNLEPSSRWKKRWQKKLSQDP